MTNFSSKKNNNSLSLSLFFFYFLSSLFSSRNTLFTPPFLLSLSLSNENKFRLSFSPYLFARASKREKKEIDLRHPRRNHQFLYRGSCSDVFHLRRTTYFAQEQRKKRKKKKVERYLKHTVGSDFGWNYQYCTTFKPARGKERDKGKLMTINTDASMFLVFLFFFSLFRVAISIDVSRKIDDIRFSSVCSQKQNG